jgi:hypothetical protein
MEISTLDEEVRLALSQCVPIRPELAQAQPSSTDSPTELALYDAAACPSSLRLSESEFNEQYRGKIAIWLRSSPALVSCDPNFFRADDLYRRLIDAGALGVVAVNSVVGIDAGAFVDLYPTLADPVRFPADELIPFLVCGNPDPEGHDEFSQDTLTSFLNEWKAAPSDRVAPWNERLFVGNITVTDNPWDSMFSAPLYVATFHAFIPFVFLLATLMAIYFIYERARDLVRKDALKWESITPRVMSLFIETLVLCFFFTFFALDGWGSNRNSPLIVLRPLFMGQLMLVSSVSAIMVAMSFVSLRRGQTNVQRTRTFLRHRRHLVLTLVATTLVSIEFVAGLSRHYSRELWSGVNLFACVVTASIAIWFAVEAHGVVKIISSLSDVDDAQGRVLKYLRGHVAVWTSVATVALAALVLLGLVGTLHPYLISRVSNWGPFWFAVLVLRATYSFAMILLLRLPHTKIREAHIETEVWGMSTQLQGRQLMWLSSNNDINMRSKTVELESGAVAQARWSQDSSL